MRNALALDLTSIRPVAAAGDLPPPDATAPTLSGPANSADGTSAMTGSIDTNEGTGTLFWYLSASAAPPDAGDLMSGTGAVIAGSQPVTAAGVQTIAASGLAPGTAYYTHFLHRDAAGNSSAIASADGFTTEAITPASSREFCDVAANAADRSTYTFPAMSIGAPSATRYVVVCLAWRAVESWRRVNSVSIGGVSAMRAVETRDTGGGNLSVAEIWAAHVPVGSAADVVVSLSDTVVRLGAATYRLEGIARAVPDHVGEAATLSAASHVIGVHFNGNLPCSISTASDDLAPMTLAISAGDGGGGKSSWRGLTKDSDLAIEALSTTFSPIAVAAWHQT
ncbi:hypothetical protein D2V17_05745 [Aurantiacibacter xanthus]|uniref:Uncharacterized protein n=1 Tax=Aurantiacibacter xanthus TaxID=1784712 RepID=A0A3A1P849_9SPHN|nr:hypothetical protein [Aurantiacibacter xanthus]RIV89767.1 hypothetical protein D2V17_05745 [Aurantiacibacter xanthus]